MKEDSLAHERRRAVTYGEWGHTVSRWMIALAAAAFAFCIFFYLIPALAEWKRQSKYTADAYQQALPDVQLGIQTSAQQVVEGTRRFSESMQHVEQVTSNVQAMTDDLARRQLPLILDNLDRKSVV